MPLTDEDLHGPWDKAQQRYADGCKSGEHHDEVSIYALVNRHPVVAALEALPIEELRRRIAEGRGLTGAEIEARQRAHRRARAEAAAAAFRAESTKP